LLRLAICSAAILAASPGLNGSGPFPFEEPKKKMAAQYRCAATLPEQAFY
jgi:hypothetical protein